MIACSSPLVDARKQRAHIGYKRLAVVEGEEIIRLEGLRRDPALPSVGREMQRMKFPATEMTTDTYEVIGMVSMQRNLFVRAMLGTNAAENSAGIPNRVSVDRRFGRRQGCRSGAVAQWSNIRANVRQLVAQSNRRISP
jgi:hypothetical protein